MQKSIYVKKKTVLIFLCFALALAFKSVTYGKVIANCEVVGAYATEFDSQKSARGKNIKLAAERIDKIIIEPGQEFSFNEAVGPTTKGKGFKLARIFIKGKDSEGYGGGVCQVSSTLYNAVVEAGLDVTERHPHSKSVSYVPENMDAATAYGGVDFKFVNNRACPIVIRAYVSDNKLTTSIEAVIGYDTAKK